MWPEFLEQNLLDPRIDKLGIGCACKIIGL